MAAGRACLIVSLTALFVLGMKEAVIPMAQAQAQTDATGGVHESEAVRIAEFRQLFIDDRVVDRMEGVTRVVNQPEKHPANPVVQLDRPWEGEFQVGGWGSVIYDTSEDLFKMWYAAHPKPEGGVTCYAFQHDALRHTVVWGGRSDVSQLAGKTIRLRFHLQSARLYSFVFSQ